MLDSLQSVPNWNNKTPEQILEYLSEIEERPTMKWWKFEDIKDVYDAETRKAFANSMYLAGQQNADIQTAFLAMSAGRGLQLHEPDKVDAIKQLAVAFQWSEELLSKALALGIKVATRWGHLTNEPLPTVEQIADWQSRQFTINWWIAKKAQVDDRLHAGTITTQQQIVDLLGGG